MDFLANPISRKTRVSLTRFVYTPFSALNSSLVIKISSFLLEQGEYLLHGNFMTLSGEERRTGVGRGE